MRRLLRSEYFPVGTQYYRAPSPARSEWDRDLGAISALGFNTVKFWVQWRWNNPDEGKFAFEDIDELMDLAQHYDLKVMLNTVVDVAPVWIYRKYPDARMKTLEGRFVGPQVQPHRQIGGLGICFNHEPATQHMLEFLGTTVRRYRDHPALEMWNVASEPELTSSMAELRLYANDATGMGDMLCYCPHCQERFRVWLTAHYDDIQSLNRAWNRPYRSFDDVEIPVTRNSVADIIDWRLFFVHSVGEQVRRRFEIAAQEDGGKHALMCHHVFIQGFPVTSTANDPWNVGKYGDLHGITQMDDPMMCDVLRCSARGRPVISAEMLMLYGYTLDLPRPVTADDVRRYVFTGVAANLKGFVFWQFRPETLAREAPAWGLTNLDGSSTPWLVAFAQVNRALQENASFLLTAKPPDAEVAILYSPENQIFAWASTGNEKTATDALLGTHAAMYRRNFVIDFFHPAEATEGLLARYRVIVVPFPYLLGQDLCALLEQWVSRGGTLIGEAYFAGWDLRAGKHNTTVPGFGLHRLFGVRQGSVRPPDDHGRVTVLVKKDLAYLSEGAQVSGAVVGESLILEGADVLAVHANGDPAVTVARHGKGRGILIGTYVGMPFHRDGVSANADLIASLAAMGTSNKRASASDGSLVRIDLLTDANARAMLIIRNLELRAVTTTAYVPALLSSPLLEQFSSETIIPRSVPGGAEIEVTLQPGEVKVYCG